MIIEDKLTDLILRNHKSIRSFALSIDIPDSTIRTMLKKGISGTSINTVIRICQALNIDVEELLLNNIVFKEDSITAYNNIIKLNTITMQKVPIIGDIACGEPILADEYIEGYVELDKDIKADYALFAKGDSMINADIKNGDIVFIQRTNEVSRKEVACVLINDEATLKYFYFDKENRQIILTPANLEFDMIIITESDHHDVKILGRAVAVHRKLV